MRATKYWWMVLCMAAGEASTFSGVRRTRWLYGLLGTASFLVVLACFLGWHYDPVAAWDSIVKAVATAALSAVVGTLIPFGILTALYAIVVPPRLHAEQEAAIANRDTEIKRQREVFAMKQTDASNTLWTVRDKAVQLRDVHWQHQNADKGSPWIARCEAWLSESVLALEPLLSSDDLKQFNALVRQGPLIKQHQKPGRRDNVRGWYCRLCEYCDNLDDLITKHRAGTPTIPS